MFKKTKQTQPTLFSSPPALFSERNLKIYENKDAWHNRFREQVTERIDEGLFSRLYCRDNGTPNASIKVLVAMMILKEAEGLSDQKLFENCRFNFLTRSAIGLFNADDAVPAESTYYLFRKRIVEDEKAGNENLLKIVFEQVTAAQCLEFEVSGKRIRMDSKLLSSNIAWLTRYELVHETLRVFYQEIKGSKKIGKETAEVLEEVLGTAGSKIVYRSTNEEVRTRLQELGELIWSVLAMFGELKSEKYELLKRVFEEQFEVEDGSVRAREKEKISAKTVQSPHDPDAAYKDKNGSKCKGFSVNVTESCNDEGLNLIGQVEVEKAGTADIEFLVKGIEKAEEIFTGKVEAAHADGAYHSPDNQKYCEDKKIELHLNAIQGSKGRYGLEMDEGNLRVTDRETGKELEATEMVTKKGERRWRIRTDKGLRYFLQARLSSRLRKKAEETPKEILEKRNNVEATIFQLGYHYPNGKSRYRGQIKHQMWANVRCLWVNFVRIWKYVTQGGLGTQKSLNNGQIAGFLRLIYEYQCFLRTICRKTRQKIDFSVN
ncbi:MAG: transposase [Acidobacteria bacterium]|nr:transposase [Acidobacteriota bacterium]